MEFKCIKFVHGTLMSASIDPISVLRSAGIQEGMKVLEAGFGPGFFTLPAAEMVGASGHLYALEISQAAFDYVEKKANDEGAENLTLLLQDVTATAFEAGTIDLCFFFGIFHKFPDPVAVLTEMHRILKPEGIMAIQTGRVPAEKIIVQVEGLRLFKFATIEGKVLKFVKE